MECPKCGTTNRDGAGFCYNCGKPLNAVTHPADQHDADQPASTPASKPAPTAPSAAPAPASAASHGLPWGWLLAGVLAVFLILAVIYGINQNKALAGQQAAAQQTPPVATAPAQQTAAPTAPMLVTSGDTQVVDTSEALIGTLDDFGSKVRFTDRFAVNGTVLDESLNPGEMIFGNAYAVHDNGYVGKSCVAFYYQAPANGGRVRFTGFEGIYFIVDANKMTLNQGIAAMRETLVQAHGCSGEVKFHELVRYGDPVK